MFGVFLCKNFKKDLAVNILNSLSDDENILKVKLYVLFGTTKRVAELAKKANQTEIVDKINEFIKVE